MRKNLKRTNKFILISFLVLTLTYCASLGNKTIYNTLDQENNRKIAKIILLEPNQKNIDFYKRSTSDFYYDELEKVFRSYQIETFRMNSIKVDFDSITSDNKFQISTHQDCDYFLIGKITRLTMMGRTRDFEVEYKLISSIDYKLKYYSRFSTTFGQTYVVVPGAGLPSEEQIMRDAIKSGLHNIERDVLKK